MDLRIITSSRIFSFALIFLASGSFFYSHRSLWLDDWDSVLFTRALDELDIANHQPHPPGYVAYVYTARLFYAITGEPETALTLCSVVSGALALGLAYILGSMLVNTLTGWLTAAVLFCIPAFSLTASVAMADVVVLPFFLISVICLTNGVRPLPSKPQSSRWIWLLVGGFLMGWGVGVRPQWIFVFTLTALLFATKMPSQQARKATAISGICGTLAWLVPVSVSMGGVGAYFGAISKQYSDHSIYRAKFDLSNFLEYYQLAIRDWADVFYSILALSAIGLVLLVWKRSRIAFPPNLTGISTAAVLALGVGIATTLWFHPLDFKRVLIPSVLPIAFLLALSPGLFLTFYPSGWVNIAGRAIVSTVILAGGVGTYNRASELHESTPPPVLAAEYIEKNFDPSNTTIVAGLSTAHLWHYLPADYRIVVDEPEGWSPAAYADDHVYIRYGPLLGKSYDDLRIYERPASVYFKHHQVKLHVYRIRNHSAHLDFGRYGWGIWGGFWTSEEFGGWARQNARGESDLRLRIRSGLGIERELRIFLDESDEPVWSSTIGTEEEALRIPLPLTREWTRIRFETPNGCTVPADVGPSDDFRCLSFAISSMQIGSSLYSLGKTLETTSEMLNLEFVGNGWSDPEDWGVWTDGAEADINLPLAEPIASDLRLEFNGRTLHDEESHPSTTLSILANGTPIARIDINEGGFKDYEFTIPRSAIDASKDLKITFQIDNPKSPQELGIGDDSRKLGFALTRLNVHN